MKIGKSKKICMTTVGLGLVVMACLLLSGCSMNLVSAGEVSSPAAIHFVKSDDVKEKDWKMNIYVMNNGSIYKMSLLDAEAMPKMEKGENRIAVSNGWIYYNSDYGLCKMKTDGTHNIVLNKNISAVSIMIEKNWVVFEGAVFGIGNDSSDYLSLYAIQTNGKDLHTLLNGQYSSLDEQYIHTDGGNMNFFIHNGKVFYSIIGKEEMSNELYCINVNGTNRENLGVKNLDWFSVSDTTLMYEQMEPTDDGNRNFIGVFTMDLKTQNITKTKIGPLNCLAADKDHFVYSFNASPKIYVSDEHGNTEKCIISMNTDKINDGYYIIDSITFRNDSIYFHAGQYRDDAHTYSIKIDGSDIKTLNKLTENPFYYIETRE